MGTTKRNRQVVADLDVDGLLTFRCWRHHGNAQLSDESPTMAASAAKALADGAVNGWPNSRSAFDAAVSASAPQGFRDWYSALDGQGQDDAWAGFVAAAAIR